MNFGEGGTAPRVNSKAMPTYAGRTVALVGAVESHMPTAVVLRTSVRYNPSWANGRAAHSLALSLSLVQDGAIVNVKPAPGSDYSR